MAIDSRLIVNVFPSVLQAGVSDLVLNGLVLDRNTTIPLSPVYHNMLQFLDQGAVQDYFGADSPEYNFAVHYFAGYDNSFRTPERLIIARYPDQAAPAWVRGDPVNATIADFKEMSDASFSISFSGAQVTITPVNLTAITSYSEVAAVLQAAIRAAGPDDVQSSMALVEYNSNFRAFTITAGGDGADGQTVSPADGTLAVPMRLTVAENPTISYATSGLASTVILEDIRKTIGDWASFTTIWEATTNEKMAFARWQAGYPVNYLYAPWDTDANGNLRIIGNTDNDASILQTINPDVAYQFGDARYSAFVEGMAASIDFNNRNSTITFAHKQQSGLPFNIDDTSEAQALIDKGVNFYGNFATRNNTFHRFYPGRTLGPWRWIDHFVNGIWLFNALNNAAMNGLGIFPKIEYNQTGLAKIRSMYMDPIGRAIQNGVINSGGNLTQAQIQQIKHEAGFDISADLMNTGYYLSIRLPDASARVDRSTTLNTLWYMSLGSVHRLDLRAVSIG